MPPWVPILEVQVRNGAAMSAELISLDRPDVSVIAGIARLRRLEESLTRAALAVSESDSGVLSFFLL